MNTFSKADAKTTYFKDKATYLAFKEAWATAFQTKTLDSRYMLLYAWLRGKDIRSAFTPVQNLNKLKNGHAIDQAISNAYWRLKHIAEGSFSADEQAKFLAVFNGELDAETLLKAFQDMPKSFGNTTSAMYGAGEKIAAAFKTYHEGGDVEGFNYLGERNSVQEALWEIYDMILTKDRAEAREKMIARQAATKPQFDPKHLAAEVVKPTLAQRVRGLFS